MRFELIDDLFPLRQHQEQAKILGLHPLECVTDTSHRGLGNMDPVLREALLQAGALHDFTDLTRRATAQVFVELGDDDAIGIDGADAARDRRDLVVGPVPSRPEQGPFSPRR